MSHSPTVPRGPGVAGRLRVPRGPVASPGPGGVPGWPGIPGSRGGWGSARESQSAQGCPRVPLFHGAHCPGDIQVCLGAPWCPCGGAWGLKLLVSQGSQRVWGSQGAHGSQCIRGAHRSCGWLRGPVPSGGCGRTGCPRVPHCTQGSHGVWEAPCPQSPRGGRAMLEARGGWGDGG